MPRALVACSLLLLGGAATGAHAAAAPEEPPQKKTGPLILPLTYKPRHHARPMAAGAWSTMSADEGGKVGGAVGGCGVCGLRSGYTDHEAGNHHRAGAACCARISTWRLTRRGRCRARLWPSRRSRSVG